MAVLNSESDYLKGNSSTLEQDAERYLRHLEAEGKTPGGCQRVRDSIGIFLRYAPGPVPSKEQFASTMEALQNHGYCAKLTKEVLSTAGRMYQFLNGVDPYKEVKPARNTHWYMVPETENPLAAEMDAYFEFIDGEPMSDVMKKRRKDHLAKAIRVLRYEKRIQEPGDIDRECFALLERRLENTGSTVRRDVLFATGQFVKMHTGTDVYRRYQNSKAMKNGFEDSPQWNAMMECMERYIADAEMRGYTEMSCRSLRVNLTTVIRRLFSICGPLFPEEIRDVHMYEYRKRSGDIKDKTVKKGLQYLGRMLKHTIGRNPMDSAPMMWSKCSESRTWIFKDEWKLMYDSATTAERLALMLGAGMGLRRNEMATLKLTDIAGNMMTIRGKGHGRGKIVDKEMPPSVIRAIEDYLPDRDALIRRYGDRHDGSLFVTPFYSNGETTLNRYVGELVKSAAQRVGVDATCHTLRRFYCTNLIDGGFEIDVVRTMMRHSCADTTLIYINNDPRKIRSATASIDSALFG